MDPATLVEGGVDGLRHIVQALEERGVPIVGAYLIKSTSDSGYEDVALQIVTTMLSHEVIHRFVTLKHEGKLPRLDWRVRIDAADPFSNEASRILKYASEAGTPVVNIRGAGLDGVYVEEAIVVKWPTREAALA
jgi:hypothetical protein